jgi:hypothetical protein
MKRTHVRFQWRDQAAHRPFRTAVSLHSHTMHSRENFGFIPRYCARVPILAWEMRRLARKYLERHRRVLDYTRGHWTPPLPGPEAYDLERRHIEETLGLAALVSLSDHDNIEAAGHLHATDATRSAPVSIEWTVPVGPTFFHVGVHNLPPSEARSMVAELARYTREPAPGLRRELLASLSRRPDILMVLNHPLWDQGEVGTHQHRALLSEFLQDCGGCIHALELNGLRPWPENQAVIDLARACDHPLVSGGDRHGCEPNSILNLTRAASFPEFVSEVRAGSSEIVFLNHYREPRRVRIFRTLCDVMGDYPELPGREHWTDRMYCRLYSGATVPLSQVWNGNVPGVVRYFDRSIRLTQNRGLRHMLRLCLAGSGQEFAGPRDDAGL